LDDVAAEPGVIVAELPVAHTVSGGPELVFGLTVGLVVMIGARCTLQRN
jgi:hypothetical protein